MGTQEGNSHVGETIETPPIERDLDLGEGGKVNDTAGQMAGKTTHMSFMAARQQWEDDLNGIRLQNETWEPVSAPGDWRGPMQ